MMQHPARGVAITPVDGGYLLEWIEPPNKAEKPGEDFFRKERQRMGAGSFRPHIPKTAVRVKIEDALKLAREVLARIEAAGDDYYSEFGQTIVEPLG